jgi:hypothetical protein
MAGAGLFINHGDLGSIARRTNFPRFRRFSKNFFDGPSPRSRGQRTHHRRTRLHAACAVVYLMHVRGDHFR